MPYKFEASKTFWRELHKLHPDRQKAAHEKFKIFQKDPFAPSLKPHIAQRLTSIYKRTIFSVRIEGDLRAAFYRDGDVIKTVSIGNHDIYK